MAEQKNNPELTITQVPLTEDTAPVSIVLNSMEQDPIKVELINTGTQVVQQSSDDIDEVSPKIVLATLNARYFHTSFGLPKHN